MTARPTEGHPCCPCRRRRLCSCSSACLPRPTWPRRIGKVGKMCTVSPTGSSLPSERATAAPQEVQAHDDRADSDRTSGKHPSSLPPAPALFCNDNGCFVLGSPSEAGPAHPRPVRELPAVLGQVARHVAHRHSPVRRLRSPQLCFGRQYPGPHDAAETCHDQRCRPDCVPPARSEAGGNEIFRNSQILVMRELVLTRLPAPQKSRSHDDGETFSRGK